MPEPGPSPGYSTWGGSKKRRRAQKPEGGPHFKNTVLDYAATKGPNVKWGAQISNGGTWHHCPPG